MPVVYVLKLKNSRRYIGYTSNFRRRMNQHFTGGGSTVTRKYKPIEIERVIPCYNIKYAMTVEKKITQWYRLIYGKNRVRGGPWTNSKTF
tara:strand:+ start:360 stop:629 length:270 start_codon:yes stop_codon:yes gene_type:complete